MKVNLNDLTNLVKRGRQAILDMNLVAEIQTIDPTIIGDAIIYDLAQGDPADDEFANHKNTWRGRVARSAEYLGVDCSVNWTTEGEMIVSLKPVKAKRNRK